MHLIFEHNLIVLLIRQKRIIHIPQKIDVQLQTEVFDDRQNVLNRSVLVVRKGVGDDPDAYSEEVDLSFDQKHVPEGSDDD